MKEIVLHEAVVHEKILFPVSFAGVLRDTNETVDSYNTGFTIHGK